MPFVHDASAELFKTLLRDKDRGFVIESRSTPLLQELTGDLRSPSRGRARDIKAEGATALTTRWSSGSTSSDSSGPQGP